MQEKNIEEKYEKPEKQQFHLLEINEYFFKVILLKFSAKFFYAYYCT